MHNRQMCHWQTIDYRQILGDNWKDRSFFTDNHQKCTGTYDCKINLHTFVLLLISQFILNFQINVRVATIVTQKMSPIVNKVGIKTVNEHRVYYVNFPGF